MEAINGSPKSLRGIFHHDFEIPDFQRLYSWEEDHCSKLWEDLSEFLDKFLSGKSKKYFLGSLVVYPKKKDDDQLLCVIDGQQRLTTLALLMRAFYEMAQTYPALQGIYYKKHISRDEVVKEPRVESKVLGGQDKNDLCEVLENEGENLRKDNKFKSNYEFLKKSIKKRWASSSAETKEREITALLAGVDMLMIKCSDEDDALTLFEIINDRGLPLSDPDIFKAKMYQVSPNKNDFISRWEAMSDHLSLFKSFMHISRANLGITDKEIGIRKYIWVNHLKPLVEEKDRSEKEKNLEHIMKTLERLSWLNDNYLSGSKNKEKIYWKILDQSPTKTYWQYPLQVFLYKNMEEDKDGIPYLTSEKQEKYMELIEYTCRYFLFKGLVYNTVNEIKGTTFKVCKAIAKDDDFISEYREDIRLSPLDKETFNDKIIRDVLCYLTLT